MRAGAAWEKWGGPCGAKARPSFLRAGAAWEKWGGPCGAKARPSFSASWRSMGEMGRAVRSQGPTILFCELAQHGRNGEGRAEPRPDHPFLRAGAAWEKWGGPCGAKARPSFSASWRSMGEMGRAVRSQGPTFLSASWRSMGEMGRAVRSQGPTILFCELAQHGRNGEGRAEPRPDHPP